MKVKFVFLRAMEMESILINNYAFLICFYTTTGMSEGGGAARFWQIRRRRRAAATRRITTCPPRFLDFGTCLPKIPFCQP